VPNHSIVHIEFPANNPEKDARFYNEAFGWKIEADPTVNYWMFQAEGGPGGGFNPTAPNPQASFSVAPSEVLVYVNTDDIDASLAKIEELGGKTLLPKSEIMGVGWFAVFTDLTGNRVALFTAKQEMM
jgi:uncharacterized protein